jgi:hypothetical protein
MAETPTKKCKGERVAVRRIDISPPSRIGAVSLPTEIENVHFSLRHALFVKPPTKPVGAFQPDFGARPGAFLSAERAKW